MTPTGPLAVAASDYGDVGGGHTLRRGELAMLVDEIRHLRECIDLIVMLTIRERDNFLGELDPVCDVRGQLDAALVNLINMPIESRRFRATRRDRHAQAASLQYSLELGNQARTIGRIFNQDRIRLIASS